MIGTQLKARPTLRTATIICVSLAVALLGMSLVFITEVVAGHLVLLALWPACLAIAFWTNRRPAFLAELAEDGILTNLTEHRHVPYDSIHAVQVEDPQQSSYPLHLHYGQKVLSIPAIPRMATIELQRFLTSRIPQNRYEAVCKDLRPICQVHLEKFGEGKVYVFTPRLHAVKGFRGTSGRAMGMGTVFAGLFMIVGGIALGITLKNFEGAGWAGFGIFLVFLGTMLAMIFSSQRALKGGMNKWRNSGLLISPLGLAVIQDKLRGEMKWDELKKLSYPVRRTSFDSSGTERVGGIRLDFGGASVDIFDIYCHPLDVVHQRIKAYWQG